MRLDRVGRDPDRAGNLAFGHLGIEPEDETLPLPSGEQPQCLNHNPVIAISDHILLDVLGCLDCPGSLLVSERHESTPIVIASEVQHDRPEERWRSLRIANRVGRSMEPDECLLHQILGCVAVITEQASETDERPTLLGEEHGDECVSTNVAPPSYRSDVTSGRAVQRHTLDHGTPSYRVIRHNAFPASGASRSTPPLIALPVGASWSTPLGSNNTLTARAVIRWDGQAV